MIFAIDADACDTFGRKAAIVRRGCFRLFRLFRCNHVNECVDLIKTYFACLFEGDLFGAALIQGYISDNGSNQAYNDFV
jgi:hypothetical protein